MENFIGELPQRSPFNVKIEPNKFISSGVFGDLIGLLSEHFAVCDWSN